MTFTSTAVRGERRWSETRTVMVPAGLGHVGDTRGARFMAPEFLWLGVAVEPSRTLSWPRPFRARRGSSRAQAARLRAQRRSATRRFSHRGGGRRGCCRWLRDAGRLFDDTTAELGATTVQGVDQLKVLATGAASDRWQHLNEGAGTIDASATSGAPGLRHGGRVCAPDERRRQGALPLRWRTRALRPRTTSSSPATRPTPCWAARTKLVMTRSR